MRRRRLTSDQIGRSTTRHGERCKDAYDTFGTHAGCATWFRATRLRPFEFIRPILQWALLLRTPTHPGTMPVISTPTVHLHIILLITATRNSRFFPVLTKLRVYAFLAAPSPYMPGMVHVASLPLMSRPNHRRVPSVVLHLVTQAPLTPSMPLDARRAPHLRDWVLPHAQHDRYLHPFDHHAEALPSWSGPLLPPPALHIEPFPTHLVHLSTASASVMPHTLVPPVAPSTVRQASKPPYMRKPPHTRVQVRPCHECSFKMPACLSTHARTSQVGRGHSSDPRTRMVTRWSIKTGPKCYRRSKSDL